MYYRHNENWWKDNWVPCEAPDLLTVRYLGSIRGFDKYEPLTEWERAELARQLEYEDAEIIWFRFGVDLKERKEYKLAEAYQMLAAVQEYINVLEGD